jgi:formyl-CoA transferase
MNTNPPSSGALSGLRVVELGQLIAGPFASKILADFGADVIKVEPPNGGDPLRNWRVMKDGTSLWWHSQSRNKRSLALDLKHPDGQDVVRRLVRDADVLIENFRPGTLESWNLDPNELRQLNPKLIVLRVSGFGQDGPYRDRPGFGVIAEAMGGLRYLTGEPGRVPVRVGVSIGDTLAALHGVIGILVALHHRNASVCEEAPHGRGQIVDVALYEAVFNCMESLLPEYSAAGVVRQAAGSELPGIAPSNAYPCSDGTHVLIAGNGNSIYRRLMNHIGRDDLGSDTDLQDNAGRVKRSREIDHAISEWTLQRTCEEVLFELERVSVPAGRVYTVADIASDPHYRARGMFYEERMPDGTLLKLPGACPKLDRTPATYRSAAPELGQDTDAILRELGYNASQIDLLKQPRLVAESQP